MSLNQMLSPELGRRIVPVSGLTGLDGNGWVISLFPSVLDIVIAAQYPRLLRKSIGRMEWIERDRNG